MSLCRNFAQTQTVHLNPHRRCHFTLLNVTQTQFKANSQTLNSKFTSNCPGASNLQYQGFCEGEKRIQSCAMRLVGELSVCPPCPRNYAWSPVWILFGLSQGSYNCGCQRLEIKQVASYKKFIVSVTGGDSEGSRPASAPRLLVSFDAFRMYGFLLVQYKPLCCFSLRDLKGKEDF